MSVEIRRLAEGDDLEELTRLLNDAYADLASRGLRFVATWQDVAITRRRAQMGECYVAIDPSRPAGSRIVGTIVLYGPGAPRTGAAASCVWYLRDDVARFGQFGVLPAARGSGLGRRLLGLVEKRAAELGAAELALDTAEPATDLIGLYARWGYRRVADIDWDSTNYRSVVLSKTLPPAGGMLEG